MKAEETEPQKRLRKSMYVVLVLGVPTGFYLFIVPFLLIWANGNRAFLDWVTGGPAWLANGWSAINRSFFIVESKFEIYRSYIAWVIELVGA